MIKKEKYNKFYVYSFIDPYTFEPFYIGKESGKRYKTTINKCMRGYKIHNKFLSRKLKKLWAELAAPTIEIIKNNLGWFEAFELENKMIIKYGRRGIEPYGILTNRSLGFEFCNFNGKGKPNQTLPHHSCKPISKKDKKFLIEAYKSGFGLFNLYKTTGISQRKISKMLSEYGITIRKQGAQVGEANSMYGVKRGPNKGFLGHKHTDASKKMISESGKARYRLGAYNGNRDI